MARAIWSGSVAFGLVNAPVRMYPAVHEHDLEFHFVHTTDGSRIGYQKICKVEDKPVPDDEVAKGYKSPPTSYRLCGKAWNALGTTAVGVATRTRPRVSAS